MLRAILLLALAAALAGCGQSERSAKSGAEDWRFTPEQCREAFLLSSNVCSELPLLIRCQKGRDMDLPCQWPAEVYKEEIGRVVFTPQEDGTVLTGLAVLAESPTNLFFLSHALAKDCPELPLPFDRDDDSTPLWEKLYARWQSLPVTNAFVSEALARVRILAPQRMAAKGISYEEFFRAFLAEKNIQSPTSRDRAQLWARTYFYLRTAVREKRFEDVKTIALDSIEIEGKSPEWHAIMAEYLRACDPTRIKDIENHYTRAMQLFAKRSRLPFYRVWVARTGLEAFLFDSNVVISHYYAILESLKENEEAGNVTPEFASAIREQAYSSIAKLLLRYDQTVNAAQWASRLLGPGFSRDAKLEGLELIFQAAEKNGRIFEAIAEYDPLINEAGSVAEKNFWRLEKGAVLMKFDLPEEAALLYADIVRDDPGLENRQFALAPENQDARFMHLYYYVLRVEKVDVRDLALSRLRKRGILNRADSSYYLRQAAQLQICMQRLKEAYNIYETIYKDDNQALLEYVYILYRNSRFDQCIALLRRLPYHKNSDVALDWRFSVVRLFRARRVRPDIDKVIADFSRHTNEITRARYLNGLGNIYQAYRQSEKAGAMYAEGIKTDPSALYNYLDLGFLYCMSANKEKAAEMLDTIMKLDLTADQQKAMRYDWRAIELYYTAGRDIPEEEYE